MRVVIDSKARLRKPLHVFDDGQARTIVLHQSSVDMQGLETQFGPKMTNRAGEVFSQVERWLVPDTRYLCRFERQCYQGVFIQLWT